MLNGGERFGFALHLCDIAHARIVLYPTREIVKTAGVFHLTVTVANFLKLYLEIAELGLASLSAECEGKHVLYEGSAVELAGVDHKLFLFRVTVEGVGNVWNAKKLLSKMKHEVGILWQFLCIGKQPFNKLHILLCLIR